MNLIPCQSPIGNLSPSGYYVYRFPKGERVAGFFDQDGQYYELIQHRNSKPSWFKLVKMTTLNSIAGLDGFPEHQL